MEKHNRMYILNRIIPIIVFFICGLVLLYVMIKNAWCSDDAYHAYSMSKNFLNGNGFTPTIGKRVNVSTCPLWTIIVTFFMSFFNDEYYVGMVLNISFSIGAFILFGVLLLKDGNGLKYEKKFNFYSCCIDCCLLVCVTFFLVISKSFISFTTSGLENPLLFFLTALFFIVFYRNREYVFTNSELFKLAFIAGMIVFTRIDSLIIVLPACLYAGLHIDKGLTVKEYVKIISKRILTAVIAVFPFIFWEFFSLLYYGMWIPNTALAKLNTGFPLYQYLERGVAYYVKTLSWDWIVICIPIIFIFLFAISFSLQKIPNRNPSFLFLSSGIALYLLYIIYIGGDFMLGRHFTVVFFMSLLGLSIYIKTILLKFREKKIMIVIVCILITTLFLVQEKKITINLFDKYSVTIPWVYVDERGIYIEYTGLCNVMKKGKNLIRECPHSGIHWYFYTRWYEDRLYDPLLSRLPANDQDDKWHVGHMKRVFPKGYTETLETGINCIESESLHKYYDILLHVVSDNIFSISRIQLLFQLNFGKYDYLIEKYLKEEYFTENTVVLEKIL